MKKFSRLFVVVFTLVVFGNGHESFAASPPTTIWAHQFGTGGYDDGSGVALDHQGNLYVTGTTTGALGQSNLGSNDAFLSKYDLNGTLQWTKQFGTPAIDLGVKVGTDPTGNVIVVGRTTGNMDGTNLGGYDMFISKFDSAGTSIWTRQLGSFPYPGDEYASNVSVDTLGNSYVVGRTTGSLATQLNGLYNAFITKYDANGNRLWAKQFGTQSDESFGVSADVLGNVFMVGDNFFNLDGTNIGDRDIFLRKYDGNGNLVWGKQLGTVLFDRSFEAAADNHGNVYFTGWTRGDLAGPNAGQYDAIVQKYDGAGNLLWSRQFGTSNYDFGFAISVDAQGNAYIGGAENADVNAFNGHAFVAKFAPDGTLLWNENYASAADEYNFGIAAGDDGTAYVVGNTTGNLFGPNAGGVDGMVYKIGDVPEPATATILILGAVSFLAFGRKLHRD